MRDRSAPGTQATRMKRIVRSVETVMHEAWDAAVVGAVLAGVAGLAAVLIIAAAVSRSSGPTDIGILVGLVAYTYFEYDRFGRDAVGAALLAGCIANIVMRLFGYGA